MMTTETRVATLEDLYGVEGKAEVIGGRIVRLRASGDIPSQIALEIAVSLREYARQTGRGVAYADGIGFALDPPLSGRRQSFSPDASDYVGPRPQNRMRFVQGPPAFAVEVRSEGDYDEAAEVRRIDKRADYFEAGTLVVWDVDPLAETIAVYRADLPDQPTIYPYGQVAEAEPAVPGWRLAVDDLFA